MNDAVRLDYSRYVVYKGSNVGFGDLGKKLVVFDEPPGEELPDFGGEDRFSNLGQLGEKVVLEPRYVRQVVEIDDQGIHQAVWRNPIEYDLAPANDAYVGTGVYDVQVVAPSDTQTEEDRAGILKLIEKLEQSTIIMQSLNQDTD